MSTVTIIPDGQVPPDLLNRLLESFISREGTDYGEVEHSLSDKVEALKAQLKRREIVIVFDGESESFNLITYREARSLGLE